MRHVRRLFTATLLASSVLAGGCSLTRRLAIGSMVPILENTAAAARERTDVDTVGRALPANLLLVDGLIRTEPGNARLLALGSFLYFGYAFGYVETEDPRLASRYYEQGRDHGLRALERRAAFRKGKEGSLADWERGLASLGRSDMPALAWAAANWGRWISLNLDSPAAIAQMPRLEALLDRMLALDPGFEHGLPEALRGTYDALRPEMFGGKPARAKEHFDRALALSERQMVLFLVFYAEFYCRQVLDEACFDALLDEAAAPTPDALPEARLMNAIGRRRAEVLRGRRDEFF